MTRKTIPAKTPYKVRVKPSCEDWMEFCLTHNKTMTYYLNVDRHNRLFYALFYYPPPR